MSDNFIPLNQSTPVQDRRQRRNPQSGFQNNWQQRHNNRRSHNHNNLYFNRWGNNSNRSNSFGSDLNGSSGNDYRNNIDAYLHPSMLQDPWAHLTQNKEKI